MLNVSLNYTYFAGKPLDRLGQVAIMQLVALGPAGAKSFGVSDLNSNWIGNDIEKIVSLNIEKANNSSIWW